MDREPESKIDQDSLGVLSSTAYVVEHARDVSIDLRRAASTADDLVAAGLRVPEWDDSTHLADGSSRSANFVLVLDALNFCFWGEPRWRVDYRGRLLDGYWALVAALRRGIEEGIPLPDARYLANLTRQQLEHILRGEHEVPLLEERLSNLREVGRVLLAKYGGEFDRCIKGARRSAVRLVQRIVADFPSFDDVALYEGKLVRFYKRAQICVADLHGAFAGRGSGLFGDLDHLTAFADYKLPQLLRHLGILSYSPRLGTQVDAKQPIAAGSGEEIEIRAATVWGVEHLRRALGARGHDLHAFKVDWLLWNMSQSPTLVEPYHRTRTIYY